MMGAGVTLAAYFLSKSIWCSPDFCGCHGHSPTHEMSGTSHCWALNGCMHNCLGVSF